MMGKVVMITGAGRGIGAATARAMAEAGASLVLFARSREGIETLAAEFGERAIWVTGDVADYPSVEAAVARGREAFGGIDVLVSNAAVIDPIGPIQSTDPEAWARAIATNLVGVYHGLRAVLPGMLAAGGGTVISVGSGAAHNPLEGWSAYCSSKAGLHMLSRCVQHELRGRIRVFSLSPGTIATDMQRRIRASGINPVSRMDFADHAPPEHPARAIVWLCSPEADDLVGTEVSLRDPAFRARIGL